MARIPLEVMTKNHQFPPHSGCNFMPANPPPSGEISWTKVKLL